MGATNSKTNDKDPMVFYAPTHANLTISKDLLSDLTGKPSEPKQKDPKVESIKKETKLEVKSEVDPDQFDRLVDEKVKLEIERIHKEQESLLKNVSDQRLTDTTYLLEHIKELNTKYLPNQPKDLGNQVNEAKDALIACYKNNPKRSLDCWKEVQNFKEAVNNSQLDYIKSQN